VLGLCNPEKSCNALLFYEVSGLQNPEKSVTHFSPFNKGKHRFKLLNPKTLRVYLEGKKRRAKIQ